MESETERAFGGAAAPPAADPREADPVLGRLDAGAEVSWQEFLHACSGIIFRVVRTFARSYDDRMDLFLFVCDGLQADGMRRVRGFRRRPEAPCRFTTYLMVVVRNLALDHQRSRDGRFRPFTNVAALDETDRIVSEYRLRDGRSLDEVRHLLLQRHGLRLGPDEIEERVARVER